MAMQIKLIVVVVLGSASCAVESILKNFAYLIFKVCSSPILRNLNLVLSTRSTGFIIGHRKEIRKLPFRALYLSRDSLRRRANARNVSFRISLRWPIHIINPVDKTKLSCYSPHQRSTTVSLETYPLIPNLSHPCYFHLKIRIMFSSFA